MTGPGTRPRARRPGLTAPLLAALCAAGVGLWPGPTLAAAPVAESDAPFSRPQEARDPALPGLLEMVYRRTIFRIDIMHLSVRVDSAADRRIRALVDGRGWGDALADSVAAAVLAAERLQVETRFLRDVTLDQFMGGMADNLDRARDDGLLSQEERDEVEAETGERFLRFAEGGLPKGWAVRYEIHGQEVAMAVLDAQGAVLLESRGAGHARRMAVLGSYLAPSSDFREDLLRSAFHRSR